MVTLVDTQATFIFPTVIWRHRVPDSDLQQLNAGLDAAVEEIIGPHRETGRIRSYQTHQALHKIPPFQGLMEYVLHAGRGVLQHLNSSNEDIVVTGCWANVNQQGIPHREHFHANNFLSGVYYVKTPAGDETINFMDPRDQVFYIAPIYNEPNEINAQDVNLSVSAGDLILFPAWLKHRVPPNTAASERMSISFNLMFRDFENAVSPPQWKGLGDLPG